MFMIIDASQHACIRKCIYNTAIFVGSEEEARKKADKPSSFIYHIKGLVNIKDIEEAYRNSIS